MRAMFAMAVICGCYSPQPARGVPCGPGGECPRGQVCQSNGLCDTTGADGDAALDDASADAPDVDAMVPVTIPFTPSNGVIVGALANVSGQLSGELAFDTDTGEITDGGQVIRPAGAGLVTGIRYYQTPELGVFALASIDVASGSTLKARGGRALVLFTTGNVTIAGTLDVSAGRCDDGSSSPRCGGPGAGDGATANIDATGCGPGGRGVGNGDTGGGGGALGQAGAAGGQETDEMMKPGGSAGSIATCPGPTLEPLVGGSGGGGGGGGGGLGGGGGGAVQVTAVGAITISGTVVSSGEGGRGASAQGGGGGGAGGAILLEAPDVTLGFGSVIAANGGGGGAGQSTDAGQPGQAGLSPAAGGAGGRAGGYGGAIAASPTTGSPAVNDTGGGGGGVGRIRINATTSDLIAAQISPAASTSTLKP